MTILVVSNKRNMFCALTYIFTSVIEKCSTFSRHSPSRPGSVGTTNRVPLRSSLYRDQSSSIVYTGNASSLFQVDTFSSFEKKKFGKVLAWIMARGILGENCPESRLDFRSESFGLCYFHMQVLVYSPC